MRNLPVFFIAALIAILAAFATVKLTSVPVKAPEIAHHESAYERVMRTGVLRCGYMLWPPYYEKDEKTGQIKGFVKDLIDQMTGMIGLKVEYTAEVILGQQAQDLNANKYDAVCFDTFITPPLIKQLDYTKPWLYLPVFLYGRGDITLPHLEDYNTNTYSFSTLDGDVSHDLAVRYFPQARLLTVPATADPSLLLLNVTTKKADFAITGPLDIDKFNKTNGSPLVKLNDQPLATYPVNFSIKKSEVDLQNLLNYMFDVYTMTGNYNEILKRYDPEAKYFIPVDVKK